MKQERWGQRRGRRWARAGMLTRLFHRQFGEKQFGGGTVCALQSSPQRDALSVFGSAGGTSQHQSVTCVHAPTSSLDECVTARRCVCFQQSSPQAHKQEQWLPEEKVPTVCFLQHGNSRGDFESTATLHVEG